MCSTATRNYANEDHQIPLYILKGLYGIYFIGYYCAHLCGANFLNHLSFFPSN